MPLYTLKNKHKGGDIEMKRRLLILVLVSVLVILLAAFLFDLISDEAENNKFNEEQILQKFDGYQWSWRCFLVMNNYTLWKENIYEVEKSGNFWIIEGNSSERDDSTKSISPNDASTILIIYDELNDVVTDWLHGEEIPDNPEINEKGKITNPTGVIYC